MKGWPLPHVPTGAKVGGALVFVGATIFGVANMHAGNTTEIRTEQVAPAPAKTGGAVTAPPVIYDDGICFTDYPGYGVLSIGFTLPPGHDGTAMATFRQGPTGAVSGTGTVTNQRGRVDVRVSQLGDYGDLYVADANGQTIGLGPFEQDLPFSATSAGSPCNFSQLKLPPPAPPEQPAATTRTVTVKKDVPPYSLLLIPGTAAALAGTGLLEERRRKRKATPSRAVPSDGGPGA